MPDGPCEHVDCVRDEPDDLVERQLVGGSGLVYVYCHRHDPLDVPELADNFEEVVADG